MTSAIPERDAAFDDMPTPVAEPAPTPYDEAA